MFCNVRESESRKTIFEILKQSKIAKRLDLSDKFWQQLETQNENTRKVMRLSEIERNRQCKYLHNCCKSIGVFWKT